MFRKFRLAAAAVSAVALASLSLGTAFAKPTTSTINSSKPSSLTIHKYEGPANTDSKCAPTGQPVPAECLTGKTPLDGATFTIYKVMDLKTNADWQTAEKYYKAGSYDTAGKQAAGTVTTAGGGTATFDGTVALYYVVETKTPDGYTGSKPFFITLPMTDPANTGWDYDLDVYPKNDKVDTPHKAVIDAQAPKVGDTIKYEVSSKVPNYGDVVGKPGEDGKSTAAEGTIDHFDLPYFVVADNFPAQLENPTVTDVTVGATTLAKDTDYQVITKGNYVQVVFTESGLDKLTAQYNGGANGKDQVKVNYQATIKSAPENGVIENTSWTVPGPKPSEGSKPGEYTPGDTPPETPENPSNKVKSQYLPINFTKIAGDTKKPLSGVKFEIRAAKVDFADDEKTVTATSCKAADINGNPVLSSFTSGAEGAATSDALRVSTWYNDGLEVAAGGNNDGAYDGAQFADKYGYLNYCLVEVEAAEGYQLLAEPIEFTLQDTLRDKASQSFKAEWIKSLDMLKDQDGYQIVNEPDNLNNKLPLTGGEGTALLSILGIALVGGGVAYYVVSNRRRTANN